MSMRLVSPARCPRCLRSVLPHCRPKQQQAAGSEKKSPSRKKAGEGKKKVDYIIIDESDEDMPTKPKASAKSRSQTAEQQPKSKRERGPAQSPARRGKEDKSKRKRKRVESSSDSESEFVPSDAASSSGDDNDAARTVRSAFDEDFSAQKPAKAKKATSSAKRVRESPVRARSVPASPPQKKSRTAEGAAPSPARRAPAPKQEADSAANEPAEKPKASSYQQHLARGPPPMKGMKKMPRGTPTALDGYTFIVTGVLESLEREEAQDLIKRCGGRVVSGVSKKVTHAVIGSDAGPSKMAKIESLKIPQIDEEGLFDMIRKVSGEKPEDAEPPKQEAPVQKLSAAEMVQKATSASASKAKAPRSAPKRDVSPRDGNVDTRLWTDKYRPQTTAGIVGNQSGVQTLRRFLATFNPTTGADIVQSGYGKKPAPKGGFRAVLLSGAPGIGKTTAATLVARESGYEAIEFNASDTRSKKSLDQVVREMTESRSVSCLFGQNAREKKRQCLIMDEVDGMSGGDRGGSAELIKIIKATRVPIICICNDGGSPKMRSLKNYCVDLTWRRPTAQQLAPRVRKIAQAEGFTIVHDNVIEMMAEATQKDIRQMINLLQLWRARTTTLSYDDAQKLLSASSKDFDLGPFQVFHKLLNANAVRQLSVNDRLDLYFVDYQLMPLFVQEHYLQNNLPVPPRSIESLECLSKAADSIAEGDIVNQRIYSQQNFQLLPIHGVLSTVRPGSYAAGGTGFRPMFPSALGKISKGNKCRRLLSEIYLHARLGISGNTSDMRLDYMPTLRRELCERLQRDGAEAIRDVIGMMDEYHITRDDVDSIVELTQFSTTPPFKLETKVKSALTRQYNAGAHAVSAVVPKAVKAAPAASADASDMGYGAAEDAVQESDDEDNDNVDNDKLIKRKAAKGRGGAAASGSGSARGRGRGRGGGRGKGRK